MLPRSQQGGKFSCVFWQCGGWLVRISPPEIHFAHSHTHTHTYKRAGTMVSTQTYVERTTKPVTETAVGWETFLWSRDTRSRSLPGWETAKNLKPVWLFFLFVFFFFLRAKTSWQHLHVIFVNRLHLMFSKAKRGTNWDDLFWDFH